MNSISKKIIPVIAFITLTAVRTNAQVIPRFEVGVNAGTLIYQGDLSPSFFGYTRSLRPAIGLYISKPIDDYFSLRLNFVRGRIGADDAAYDSPAWRQQRNFKFSSSITELTGMISWNPYAKIDRYDSRRLSPYFFAGAGLTLLNVHRDWSAFNASFFGDKSRAVVGLGLGLDTLYKTPGVVLVFPVGAGLRYTLSERVSLNAEATYRFTASDLLDGFKYSADPKSKDYYYGLSVGLSYRFGDNLADCPKVRL